MSHSLLTFQHYQVVVPEGLYNDPYRDLKYHIDISPIVDWDEQSYIKGKIVYYKCLKLSSAFCLLVFES